MRAVNLHHLELFYHVARSGGISRAVRRMPYGVQQPAVSIQVLALEEHLGVKLFERQPFRLTVEGRELFEVARPFFEQLAAVERRLQGGRAPLFRIGGSELVLRDYLPPLLAELRARHPALRFRLRSGFQEEMERWLREGEIDLAIVPLEARPTAGLHAVALARLPLALLVPAASPLRAAGELWAQDPIREPLVCLPAGEAVARAFHRGLRQLKVEWPTAVEASSMELVTRYVANGYGVGVTVNLPALVDAPGVRVLPLAGFDEIEMAALWCEPATALQREVREAVVRRARELFPAPAAAARGGRRRKGAR